MLNPVTYCPQCDTLTKHCEGEVIGYNEPTKVYHRDCLQVVTDGAEEYYLPLTTHIPVGYTLVG